MYAIHAGRPESAEGLFIAVADFHFGSQFEMNFSKVSQLIVGDVSALPHECQYGDVPVPPSSGGSATVAVDVGGDPQ